MRIASVQIGVTWPAARVAVEVTLAGIAVAVDTLPVAVTDVALRSMIGVDVTVAVSLTEITGEAEGEGVSEVRGIAVSVATPDGSVARAVSVCATAVWN